MLLDCDGFLCGSSLAQQRYQAQGTRPALVFACPDARRADVHAGGRRSPGRPHRRDRHPSRALVLPRSRPHVLRRRCRHAPAHPPRRSPCLRDRPGCTSASPANASLRSPVSRCCPCSGLADGLLGSRHHVQRATSFLIDEGQKRVRATYRDKLRSARARQGAIRPGKKSSASIRTSTRRPAPRTIAGRCGATRWMVTTRRFSATLGGDG